MKFDLKALKSTMAEQSMLLASLFSLVPLGNVLQLL